ncbi:sulfotransferase [Candidatus Leptofilum sp.]|uniref:sulfotransferase n=1 Tax=Candidatus Leptofilum sp. TaxID=3241576 RepID=UPI003B5A89C5
MSQESSKLKILYIAGEGRSGSTIIGNVLGEIEGFFFIGEAMNIWRHFFLDNKLCACGVPGLDCPVWHKILNNEFKISSTDAKMMERQRKNSVRNRYVWKYLFSSTRNNLRKQLSNYLSNLDALYASIAQETNADVIVDSSKRPTYAFLLGMLPNVEIYTLHLVRDSRGVAHSWAKKKVQQQTEKEVIYMRQYSPFKSALRWNIANFLTERLLRHASKAFITLRYEDFVSEPTKSITNIFELLKIPSRNYPADGHKGVYLSTNHAIWGNPSRFQKGAIQLKQDVSWREKLPRNAQRIITLFTWFGLRRYGYLGID